MLEIIVGVWVGSLAISIIITGLNIWYAYKLTKSPKYLVLNKNLAKVDSYWSLSNENFKNFSEGSAKDDEKKQVRNFLLLGSLGFLSAIGLFFLIVLTLSLQFLVKSRLTRHVFRSELATNPELTAADVTKLVLDFKTSGL